MNISGIGIIISLLFAPSFVVALYYFDFNSVAFVYCMLTVMYLILSLVFKQDIKSVSTPLIYFVFVLLAYMLSSMELVKMIPAFVSAIFFFIFAVASVKKKEFILKFTKKFYKKELSAAKQKFLASSDGYWALVILSNTLIQIGLVFLANNELWAFYSSVGWYIFLALALLIQVVYEKLFITSKLDAT